MTKSKPALGLAILLLTHAKLHTSIERFKHKNTISRIAYL